MSENLLTKKNVFVISFKDFRMVLKGSIKFDHIFIEKSLLEMCSFVNVKMTSVFSKCDWYAARKNLDPKLHSKIYCGFILFNAS